VTNFVWVVDELVGPFAGPSSPSSIASQSGLSKDPCQRCEPTRYEIRLGEAAHAQHPLPAVLALDMAGIVEEVGSGVASFEVGDEVYGMVGGVGDGRAHSLSGSLSMPISSRTSRRISQ